MSGTTESHDSRVIPAPSLRRDLITWLDGDDGSSRPTQIVYDEISGKFARVSTHVWQSLTGSNSPNGVSSISHTEAHGQAEAIGQASVAGWTRERRGTKRSRFSPLYIRIALFRVDSAAVFLARHTHWIFSDTAVRFWRMMMVVASLLIVSRFNELARSLSQLPTFLAQSNPWTIALIFAATKLAHELAHAIACRRSGAKCGAIGVLLLCGFPCPFCDVSDVWRVPSHRKRAKVMMAGIYVEWIIAAVATFVWCASTDPWIQFHALNVVIICSVSTLIFNANPLMRYDGYFVLSDWLRSVNLRRESRQAFASVIKDRLFLRGDRPQPSVRRRDFWLSGYHAASTVYRGFVTLALATMLIGVAEWLQLKWVGIAVIGVFACLFACRVVKRGLSLFLGQGRFKGVSMVRRIGFLFVLFGGLLATGCWIPMPRQCQLQGRIDASTATKVFLPSEGVIDIVNVDYGHKVREGEELMRVRDDAARLEVIELAGQVRVASLRSQTARLSSLDSAAGMSSHDSSIDISQWDSLHAVEHAVEANLASAQRRLNRVVVRAPIAGVVIPPASDASERRSMSRASSSLLSHSGQRSETGATWCRISSDGKLFAVLEVDATHRRELTVGTPLRISEAQNPNDVRVGKIVSISAIRSDDQSLTRTATFRVLCELPQDVNSPTHPHFVSRIGGSCVAVADLPGRTLAATAKESFQGWFR